MTFCDLNLQNLIRSSERANEYSVSISSIAQPFVRYCGNKMSGWTNRRTNVVDGQHENIMPSLQLRGVEGIKTDNSKIKIYIYQHHVEKNYKQSM